MRLKLKDFRSVNFHDSKLLKTEERSGYIRMEIDSGLIWLPLNEPTGKWWVIRKCSLECYGVTITEKREWNDSRQKQWNDVSLAKPCLNPSLSFVDMISNEVEDDFLTFEGFTRDKTFVAWRVTAQYFELNWQAQEEFNG